MMFYKYKKNNDFVRDLILIIFGDKMIRDYVKKVPAYCRYECGAVLECRNHRKDWKTKKGCMLLNS